MKKNALVAFLFAGLAVAWYSPSSLSPADTVPDSGDPVQIAYILAWDAHQIVRDPVALYESNSFFPYAHSLAFAEHLLPEALLVAPIQWLTGNAVLAANASAMLGLCLSALAMWLLVTEWTGSAPAGVVAAVLYAFNTFTRTEAARLQLLHLQWWPLALLMLSRYARDRRPRQAWAFAGFMLLQGLSCTYYLVFSTALVPLWLVGVYLWQRRRPSRSDWAALLASGTVAAAVAAVILSPLLLNIQAMGFEKTWTAGVDLLAYLRPESRHVLWGFLAGATRANDTPHFLGFAGMLLMFIGGVVGFVNRALRPLAWTAAATAVLGFVFSLGPDLLVGGKPIAPAPYGLLYDHVPLMRGMASPERFAVLVRFGGAILGGFATAALAARVGPTARPVLVAALGFLLVAEHWTAAATPFVVPTRDNVPAVYRWLAADSRGPLVELPVYPDRVKRLRSTYLYFSAIHWRPIPLGRTSFYPPDHDYLAWNLRDFPDHDSVEILRRLGIRTLVVHPLLWREPRRSEHLQALDADPRLRLVQHFDERAPQTAPELGLGEERVYRIMDDPAGDPVRRPCEPSDELPRSGWSLEHSGRKRPDLARDAERKTAWFTHEPQRPGDFFQVRLDSPARVAAIAIELSYPYDEFPRNLALEVSADDRTWQRWSFADRLDERWQVMSELIHTPLRARMILRPEPTDVIGVRLSIARGGWDDAWPQWRISEMRLYSECQPGIAGTRVVGSDAEREQP